LIIGVLDDFNNPSLATTSANSQRRPPSEQVDLDRSGDVGSETTGSLSRPGRTAAARAEQPTLSLFPMALMAKTIASGVVLTNAWLPEQRLLSMKTLRAQLAPLRRTA
jgi:hypothetical protein